MELFDPSGHLTDRALLALVRNEELDELARLELAEHLAYCDRCLQRYTALLADATLLVPAHSCRESLWRRIQARTLRLLTSRYATAAAAVALALTLLWGGAGPHRQDRPRPLAEAGTAMTEWAADWPQNFQDAFSGLAGWFDSLGSEPGTTQGGTHP